MHRLFSTFWYLKICQKYFFKDRKVQFFYWKSEIQGFLPMFIWMRWYNAVGLQRQTWKKPALKCSWSRAHVGSIHKQKHQKNSWHSPFNALFRFHFQFLPFLFSFDLSFYRFVSNHIFPWHLRTHCEVCASLNFQSLPIQKTQVFLVMFIPKRIVMKMHFLVKLHWITEELTAITCFVCYCNFTTEIWKNWDYFQTHPSGCTYHIPLQ